MEIGGGLVCVRSQCKKTVWLSNPHANPHANPRAKRIPPAAAPLPNVYVQVLPAGAKTTAQ
jgi:hypothetical protein